MKAEILLCSWYASCCSSYCLVRKRLKPVSYKEAYVDTSIRVLLNDSFLQWSPILPMIAAFVLIASLGFFMEMPFAIGIAGSFQNGKGAVGWAWAINGLFTVLGGVLSIIMAIYVGFFVTLTIAFALYLLAGALLPRFVRVQQ